MPMEDTHGNVQNDILKTLGDLHRDRFQELLDGWPEEWDNHPSHIRRVWGTGYKGELMLVEHAEVTRKILGKVVEGNIVPGTTAYDRPTQPLKAITDGRPKPSDMPPRTVHPAVRLGHPGGS
jgi:hypothetical protein